MILSHYCSNQPIFRENKLKGKKYYSLEFRTRYLPCFNELHGFFYKNKVKVVPDNIYDLLTRVR